MSNKTVWCCSICSGNFYILLNYFVLGFLWSGRSRVCCDSACTDNYEIRVGWVKILLINYTTIIILYVHAIAMFCTTFTKSIYLGWKIGITVENEQSKTQVRPLWLCTPLYTVHALYTSLGCPLHRGLGWLQYDHFCLSLNLAFDKVEMFEGLTCV